MLRLLRRDVIPQGGWVYTQSPTGTVIKAPTWQELLRRIRRFRIANGIHIERDFEEAVGQDICRQQNWGYPTCQEKELPTVEKRQLGTLDVVNFLKVLKHWVFHNPALVEPAEADRRAAICATCPHNIDATGCFGCANVAGMIFDVIKDRSTPYDDQLKNCQVCGCVNRAQVWVPKETLDKGVTAEMREDFPAHCWKK